MILKYDFWILKKYYIETIRFIINNFIFQIIHSLHTQPNIKIILYKNI